MQMHSRCGSHRSHEPSDMTYSAAEVAVAAACGHCCNPKNQHYTQVIPFKSNACHTAPCAIQCPPPNAAYFCVDVGQEHARDSFENVLFSLCRFFELTGHYPAQMTAVSYLLKQQRFEQLHRAAVKFPASHFHFIGTPVPEGATGAAAVCCVVVLAQLDRC